MICAVVCASLGHSYFTNGLTKLYYIASSICLGIISLMDNGFLYELYFTEIFLYICNYFKPHSSEALLAESRALSKYVAGEN